MEQYAQVWKKGLDFNGRASRQEYWMAVLMHFLFTLLIGIVMTIAPIFILNYIIYFLGSIVPFFALAVRRLHDTNKSGAWILIGFIPFGSIVLLVFFCLDSDPGSNMFGVSPKDRNGLLLGEKMNEQGSC